MDSWDSTVYFKLNKAYYFTVDIPCPGFL